MTPQQIIRMARESGVWDNIGFTKEVEQFATLVAAAEREACALLVEHTGIEGYGTLAIAAAIRARGDTPTRPYLDRIDPVRKEEYDAGLDRVDDEGDL